MIAERAYLQALNAVECYNRSHDRLVEALKDHMLNPEKESKELVDAHLLIKTPLLCELCDVVNTAKKNQASVYRKFRQYLQGRWPSWSMPENIELLVNDFKKVYGE